MAEIGLMGYPEISHSEHFFKFDCKMPPKPWVIVTLHQNVPSTSSKVGGVHFFRQLLG